MRQEDLIEIDDNLRRALLAEELVAIDDDAFDETIDGAVRSHAGDPEGTWEMLTYDAYDPKKVLRALRDHHDADAEIDPIALMETFMEVYDYRYAHYARFTIGNIIGHKHMVLIRTRGKRYWQIGMGQR